MTRIVEGNKKAKRAILKAKILKGSKDKRETY